ncbi:MAG: proton-conducting transporter membrane subunit [Actinomycetes bacterium]
MNFAAVVVLGQGVFTVLGTLASFLPPNRRALAAGLATGLLGATGFATGMVAFTRPTTMEVGSGLAQVSIRLDPLGGIFLLIIGLLALAASCYAVGYVSGPSASRTSWIALTLFIASMQLVAMAGSVAVFVVGWESMAVTSLLLVWTEHQHSRAVRSAGLWYAAMSQLGFLLILGMFALLVSTGGQSQFLNMHSAVSTGSPLLRSGVFLLALAGFGMKAGLVPVHVWLPRAHPEAPSHVSALMSGAMVSLGIYGLIRIVIEVLGRGPIWWGLLLLAFGGVSALYGVLQAVVATDLKRLLAYSTTENMGLATVAIGAALLFVAADRPIPAGVAIGAALLLVVNHAFFKGLLFLAAGAVLKATGLRDLDRLGGLVSRMPTTARLFAVGALAAAALPPANGFVSEWLLLQSLVQGERGSSTVTALALPIAVAVVALTAGLAVATFVKAFGIGFLARPRSEAADLAVESPMAMRFGMGLLALIVVILGLFPTAVLHWIALATTIPGARPITATWARIQLAGGASLAPPMLVALTVAFGALMAGFVRWHGRPRRTGALTWGNGGVRLSSRMEYTATSFAEPLQRVFDNILRPEQDVSVTPVAESRYLVERVGYEQRVDDVVETRFYQPLLAIGAAWGDWGRRLAPGSVHRYVGYVFGALLIAFAVISL